jgi:hypothetical protein
LKVFGSENTGHLEVRKKTQNENRQRNQEKWLAGRTMLKE